MSLKRAIRRATKIALAAMPEKNRVTYQRTTTDEYDTTTGAASRPNPNQTPVDMWITSYKESETDGTIVLPGDARGTIDATDISFKPEIHDRILDHLGRHWEVLRTKLPPPGFIYILQLRKPRAP